MRVEYLQEYLVLAETRSFTIAAKRLYLTQPALSKHISSLERELNVQLVERSTHAVSLTPAGAIAAEQFTKVVDSYDDALHAISLQGDGYLKEFRIGFLLHSLDHHLYLATKELQSINPNFKITIIFKDADELINDLVEGTLDICLLMNVSLPHDEGIHFEPVKKRGLCVMILDDDPLSSYDTLTIKQIADRTLVLPQGEGAYPNFIRNLYSEHDAALPNIIYSTQKSTQLYTMRESQGISIVTKESQKNLPPNVKLVDLQVPYGTVSLCWAYKESDNSPELCLFLESAQAVMERADI